MSLNTVNGVITPRFDEITTHLNHQLSFSPFSNKGHILVDDKHYDFEVDTDGHLYSPQQIDGYDFYADKSYLGHYDDMNFSPWPRGRGPPIGGLEEFISPGKPTKSRRTYNNGALTKTSDPDAYNMCEKLNNIIHDPRICGPNSKATTSCYNGVECNRDSGGRTAEEAFQKAEDCGRCAAARDTLSRKCFRGERNDEHEHARKTARRKSNNCRSKSNELRQQAATKARQQAAVKAQKEEEAKKKRDAASGGGGKATAGAQTRSQTRSQTGKSPKAKKKKKK